MKTTKSHGWNVGDSFEWQSVGKTHTGTVTRVDADCIVVTFSDRRWPVSFSIVGPQLELV